MQTETTDTPGPSVLIVDDDLPTREALRELLELDGDHVAGEATNGREALAMLRNGCDPDVILLDLDMPVMDGWQFVAALHDSRMSALPVVVFSSDAEHAPRSAPVVAALKKGNLDPVELCDMIRSAASHH